MYNFIVILALDFFFIVAFILRMRVSDPLPRMVVTSSNVFITCMKTVSRTEHGKRQTAAIQYLQE